MASLLLLHMLCEHAAATTAVYGFLLFVLAVCWLCMVPKQHICCLCMVAFNVHSVMMTVDTHL